MKKAPASYRVIKYWKRVSLEGMPFHTDYMVVPETKVRSDEIPDSQFEAIVKAVKASNDLSWMIYTIEKKLVEASPKP